MSDGPDPTPTRIALPFEVFYGDHVTEVHRGLTLALGSSDLASDATAEAMARAYARWDRVGDYDRPAAWVYRVGMNWATSRFRKRRRETLTSFEPGSPAAERSDGDARGTAHQHAADQHTSDPVLARALGELSVEQRSVVVLRYLLDWSEAETAIALGIAPGTVKSRLNRALGRLAQRLDDPNRTHDSHGGAR